ncbi:MAG TPA: tripartite tricarboxylate transporter substrate binding protein [Alicycliphilus sp.]|nr:tripartite tricarboxylate transporter substrate binding protein [Alicycliphilus sp.]
MQSLNSRGRRDWMKQAAACAAALCAPMARAANPPAWPAKPVSLIVPFPAGGPIDALMRALAHALSAPGNASVVVLNQPGASGTLGPTTMARAAADGATLAVITPSVFRLPHVQKVGYDPLKDFSYIAGLTSFAYAVSVPAESRWKSLAEVVAHAKANPGRLNVAVVGTGLGYIATHHWQKKAGISVNPVSFKGGADAMVALLGGHVDLMFEAGWGAMAQAGKVRLLAAADTQRLPGWPDLPTMAELGYDVSVQSVIGIAGPKNMDPALVTAIQDAVLRASGDEKYQRALATESMPSQPMNAREYTDYAVRQFAAERDNARELGLANQ